MLNCFGAISLSCKWVSFEMTGGAWNTKCSCCYNISYIRTGKYCFIVKGVETLMFYIEILLHFQLHFNGTETLVRLIWWIVIWIISVFPLMDSKIWKIKLFWEKCRLVIMKSVRFLMQPEIRKKKGNYGSKIEMKIGLNWNGKVSFTKNCHLNWPTETKIAPSQNKTSNNNCLLTESPLWVLKLTSHQ